MDVEMLMNEAMLVKLEGARSAKDVLAIAREYGRELAPEQAVEIFRRMKALRGGEPDDEDLDGVAGR